MAIPGVSLNLYIIAVNLRDWARNARTGICDKILFSTAVICALLQLMITSDTILYYFTKYQKFDFDMILFIFMFTVFLIHATFWNTSCLSIYCCFIMVNFTHHIICRVKTWFLSKVNWLLVGSVVASFAINLPLFWTEHLNALKNTTKGFGNKLLVGNDASVYLSVIVGSCLPFLLTFLSNGLSVLSILRHILRMRKNQPQFTCPQFKAHVQASRSMTVRVIMDLIFQINIGLFVYTFEVSSNMQMMCWTVVALYPSTQALISIVGNPKLRKSFLWFRNVAE
ncbi:taste receptor type 2 member 7-like [Hyperolius riggenbachi]|uniref:taste receptor type 2 member 7-like n=1 Tax=Hyperolius riggenbachi TaxID=752182 RepID=UPI0035A27C24